MSFQSPLHLYAIKIISCRSLSFICAYWISIHIQYLIRIFIIQVAFYLKVFWRKIHKYAVTVFQKMHIIE